MCHTSNLDVWSFYRTEALAHGTPYDIELTDSSLTDREELTSDGLVASSVDSSLRRTVLNGCYDNIELMQPAVCNYVLSVSVHVCLCVSTGVFVCVYRFVCLYVCVCVYRCVCVFVFTGVSVCVCVCVCV